uniref:Uncharacterized protein n=1 Tax=Rhizophora mucronata TaxID=61149 RepID=A0A2P2PAD3_RHIMU
MAVTMHCKSSTFMFFFTCKLKIQVQVH